MSVLYNGLRKRTGVLSGTSAVEVEQKLAGPSSCLIITPSLRCTLRNWHIQTDIYALTPTGLT